MKFHARVIFGTEMLFCKYVEDSIAIVPGIIQLSLNMPCWVTRRIWSTHVMELHALMIVQVKVLFGKYICYSAAVVSRIIRHGLNLPFSLTFRE